MRGPHGISARSAETEFAELAPTYAISMRFPYAISARSAETEFAKLAAAYAISMRFPNAISARSAETEFAKLAPAYLAAGSRKIDRFDKRATGGDGNFFAAVSPSRCLIHFPRGRPRGAKREAGGNPGS